jgi:hypothetical protein
MPNGNGRIAGRIPRLSAGPKPSFELAAVGTDTGSGIKANPCRRTGSLARLWCATSPFQADTRPLWAQASNPPKANSLPDPSRSAWGAKWRAPQSIALARFPLAGNPGALSDFPRAAATWARSACTGLAAQPVVFGTLE